MKINISGQHMSVGQALMDHINEKVSHIISRYFDHATTANIHLLKHNHSFRCDIIIHDGTGRHTIIKSSADCNDSYSSFDIALAKSEKQLRRYKDRLKDRHDRIKLSEVPFNATSYTIAPENTHSEPSEDSGLIIAEKQALIETLSVQEAVMKMDLENLPVVMFRNIKNNRLNVVYHRDDGNITWLDHNEEIQ